ncbi:hypothetical protein Afil01_02830 [Actinorhabdospora filicis]|uniref:Uncharacterized protein n=1 Tax=Actinorhabdospora filicis TaxID=1785913 RepID=A0A9W6SIW0_9ACTN|nr:hypothetical protein Afil01_02830 [Actinorhabdospora filicis]
MKVAVRPAAACAGADRATSPDRTKRAVAVKVRARDRIFMACLFCRRSLPERAEGSGLRVDPDATLRKHSSQ